MQDKLTGYDPLIDGFFKAINQLQFEQAELILSQMRTKIPDHAHYDLWSMYLAGVLEQEQNRDWAKAERIFQHLLAASPPEELCADVYLSLGISYENQARWTESIDASLKGITIWDKLNRPIKKTMLLRQIAIAYYRGFEAGDLDMEVLDRARGNCEEALTILSLPSSETNYEGLYEVDPLLYRALTHQVLGIVYTCMRDYQLARNNYHQFLELSILRQNQFHIGAASWYLADVLQLSDLEAWQDAIILYEAALAIFQQKQEVFFQAHLLASKGSLYRRRGLPQQAIPCYQESMKLLETIRLRISSEEARGGFFSTVVNIHDNSVLAQLDAGNISQALESAELARSRVILDRLVGPSTNLLDHPRTISISTLQACLSDNEILLEFHCTGLLKQYHGQHAEQQAANNVLYPEAKTLLFAVTRSSIGWFKADISPNSLLPSDLTQPSTRFFSSFGLRRRLYEALILPVADLLEGKKRLYLIPHGPLHYVPFHALIAADGETLLREEGPELVYAPSATILFRQPPTKKERPPGICLAIGYNGEGEMRLRFAEEEAAYIAHMAKGAALVGSTSKKAALYQQAPDYQALHFSCHGEFDPDAPLESLLHIGPGETLTGQEIIDHLRLNCSLVTLSACESGLSKVQRGDELYGLLRAFMYAGAPAIIATLWRVDERSTLIFAEKFYQLEQQGLSYATALKAAQLYLKTLTRKEAIAILTRYLRRTTEKSTDHYPSPVQSVSTLRGFTSSNDSVLDAVPLDELLPHGAEDDQPFADPQYWAPFVLIGHSPEEG